MNALARAGQELTLSIERLVGGEDLNLGPLVVAGIVQDGCQRLASFASVIPSPRSFDEGTLHENVILCTVSTVAGCGPYGLE
jgi:hypothetical protein